MGAQVNGLPRGFRYVYDGRNRRNKRAIEPIPAPVVHLPTEPVDMDTLRLLFGRAVPARGFAMAHE